MNKAWNDCYHLCLKLLKSESFFQHELTHIYTTIQSNTFLSFCEHHRITPQIHDALSDFLIPHSLKTAHINCTKTALTQLWALKEIAQTFDQNNINWLTFKGITFSQLTYQHPAKRQCKDIDLLVHPEDLIKAESILFDLGYCRTGSYITPFSHHATQFYQKIFKDFSYQHLKTGVIIELHWQLLPFMDSNERALLLNERDVIDIAGYPIHTLSKAYLYIYLCTHGYVSYWYRLHWLIDLWNFSQIHLEYLDKNALLEKAKTLKLHRSFYLASILLEQSFNYSLLAVPSTSALKASTVQIMTEWKHFPPNQSLLRHNLLLNYLYKFRVSPYFAIKSFIYSEIKIAYLIATRLKWLAQTKIYLPITIVLIMPFSFLFRFLKYSFVRVRRQYLGQWRQVF